MHPFAAVIGAGVFAHAGLAPAPELLAPPAAVVSADHELTLAAKTALAADPVCRPLAVLISVVDGRAVVGGAVPTDAAAARVGAVLTTVPGLKAVTVECWVAVEDPVRAAARDLVKPKADARPPAVVVAMKAEPFTGGFLMDPAPAKAGPAGSVPIPPAPPGPPQYPTIPSPKVPVAAADDLATAVETMRAADARFARLRAVVSGDVVTVSGAAADGAAWDFVSAVRKVPGVARVRVGRVSE